MNNMNQLAKLPTACLAVLLFCLPAVSAPAQKSKLTFQPAPDEDFYIISSVESAKGTLVLKLPSEVTTVMAVIDKTTYLDENGRPMRFSDLRAGDTVWIKHAVENGQQVAKLIHKGPMTVQELHRRYLKFQ